MSNRDWDEMINRAAAQIRAAVPTDDAARHAKNRVWTQLTNASEPLKTMSTLENNTFTDCTAFRAALPEYVAGKMDEPRAVLVRDHTRECVACRKALTALRTDRAPARRAVKKASLLSNFPRLTAPARWAVAAGLLCALSAGAWLAVRRYVPTGAAGLTVQAADGAVWAVSSNETRPLNAGAQLQNGERLRVGPGATAQVTLSDGSHIEAGPRAEFGVTVNGNGATIALDKGQIIVEAAKQKDGKHLAVQTRDGAVSVVGTIFSVNSATKGTRVAVVEGQVNFAHGSSEQALKAGEQAATSPTIEPASVAQEVAWSKKASAYNNLLAGLNAARADLAGVQQPAARTSTRFLDMQPVGTVFYAALPNLTGTLSETHRLMQERAAQNPALRDFLERERGSKASLDKMIARLQTWGRYVGEEVVLSAAIDDGGDPANPLIMGSLTDANGFRGMVEQQIREFHDGIKYAPEVVILDDPLARPVTRPADEKDVTTDMFFVWIGQDFFVIAPHLVQVQDLAKAVKSGTPSAFKTTDYYNDLAASYRGGVGLLLSADVQKIIAAWAKTEKSKAEAYQKTGLTNLRRVIVEQKYATGRPVDSRATLNFANATTGVPAWLAAPGPIGALSYIGPEANAVGAFSVAQPSAMVGDLLKTWSLVTPETRAEFDKAQDAYKIQLTQEIAATLGGEMAFALDGPALPTPSWKLVLEVNDTARLQPILERIVATSNQQATRERRRGYVWTKGLVDGRTYYDLRSADTGLALSYTYADGYLIAAPSRALVQKALQYRDAGTTILTSARFRAALPSDANPNFSALLYHDLAPIMAPIAAQAQKMGNLTPEQRQAAATFAKDAPPTLAYAYANGERLVFASSTEGGPFGLSPMALFGVPTAFELHGMFAEAMGQKK